jgi:hypothetical protein
MNEEKAVSNQPTDKPVKYNKKQQRAVELFFDPTNKQTFGNFYQSAVAAGFSKSYANIITTKKSNLQWVHDIKEQLTKYDPEHIYRAFQDVAMNSKQDRDKLKALEMMGKAQGMFIDRVQQDVQVRFVNDVPRPESERVIVEAQVISEEKQKDQGTLEND